MDCPICASRALLDQPHPEVQLYRCNQCGHRFSRIRAGLPTEPYSAEYFQETHRNWFMHPDLRLFGRIARLLEREPEPRSLIDVGCGNGNLLRYLAKQAHVSASLTGLDLVGNVSTKDIEFIQGDATHDDINRKFSVVVSLATIEHVADINAFTERLRALVTPGGLIVVTTPNDDSILYGAARLMRRLGLPLAFNRLYSRHHLHHFNPRSLPALLQKAGLRPITVVRHNAPLKGIDIPGSSPTVARLLRFMVGVLFLFGSLTRRTYQQTVICRSGPPGHE